MRPIHIYGIRIQRGDLVWILNVSSPVVVVDTEGGEVKAVQVDIHRREVRRGEDGKPLEVKARPAQVFDRLWWCGAEGKEFIKQLEQ